MNMNMIIEMVFIAFLLICGPSISMSISSSCDENYLEGKQLVESIKFDDLQTSTFLNGTEIKVTPSAEYPEDKIVEYKNVRFPVENHDGESVVVATYAINKGE